MDLAALERTRTSLHGIAELVMAGPQWAITSDIRLRVVPGGFATVAAPDLRVAADALVTSAGIKVALRGTYGDVAAAAGVEASDLREVYADGPGVGPGDEVEVDPECAALLLGAFARGDAALRSFAPAEVPVLWPEHFDVAVAVGEVNYGVSPGDAAVPEPYAYVGPWQPRSGSFWNMPFGAARAMSELAGPQALVEFFAEGARRASEAGAGQLF